ncbi:hypothetical protein ACA910_014405 [Epithemia clementina (nom. ined.)]
MHQVIPHVTVEHGGITSSDLHLDPSAGETCHTSSPNPSTIYNCSAEEPSHMHIMSDNNLGDHIFIDPSEEYALNPTFVHLSAENGKQFNACAIKNDQETKDNNIDIDDSDQVTKTIVGIENHDEDATKTMVNI